MVGKLVVVMVVWMAVMLVDVMVVWLAVVSAVLMDDYLVAL